MRTFAIVTTSFLLLFGKLYAQHALQHPNLKIDTAYTVFSALKKHKKKYPDIKIATVKPSPETEVQENIVYRTYANQRDMHIDIYKPKSGKKRPAILMVHGGGWVTGDKSLLSPFAVALANEGYVCATVEYRFSDEELYPAAVIDVYSALRWLHKNADRFAIDKNKISIMGSSAGAQLASLVGASWQESLFVDPGFLPNVRVKPQSIINLDGVLAFLHPLSKEGGTPKKPGAATKWFGIHFTKDSTKWKEASALKYVDKDCPPIVFIASSRPRFNAGRENVIQILKKHDIYYEKFVFDGAPHSFWLFHPWFDPTLEQIKHFLAQLKD